MVFDLHSDLPTSTLPLSSRVCTAQSEHSAVVYAVWTTRLADPWEYIRAETSAYRGTFSIEDLWFVSDELLPSLCDLPVLYATLTHNRANALAGGAHEDAPLSMLGRRVLGAMRTANIALDTAHLGQSAFFAALECGTRVLNSHTGLMRVHPHARNLTDAQVRLLLERGGIVGLTPVSDFIDGDTIEHYVRLIDCFVQAFGPEGACIGTDFYGATPLKGLQSYADFAFVAEALKRLGYTAQDVENIFYKNAQRYFGRTT